MRSPEKPLPATLALPPAERRHSYEPPVPARLLMPAPHSCHPQFLSQVRPLPCDREVGHGEPEGRPLVVRPLSNTRKITEQQPARPL